MAGYVWKGTEQPDDDRSKDRYWLFNPDLCGTNAGYHQHYRHKQPACEPCKAGHQEYDAEYRAKKRKEKK
jgi:hypothetical protein